MYERLYAYLYICLRTNEYHIFIANSSLFPGNFQQLGDVISSPFQYQTRSIAIFHDR